MYTRKRLSAYRVMLASSAAALAAIGCAARPVGFSFAVTADMRSFTPPTHGGPEYFRGVCEAIRDAGPGAFMIIAGDLDPPDRVRATLDDVLGRDYTGYPVVGNHELDEPEYMASIRACNGDRAALPGIVRRGPPGAEETCYAFDYQNAHFVAINQYYDGVSDSAADGDVSDALYAWLAEDLAATDKKHVFVVGHEPTVSIPDMDNGRVRHRGDSLDKYPENNHRFWSLLRRHKVVAYFNGHTHNASIAKINGVWQVDPGHARGAGDPGARSSFVKVRVDADGVRCDLYRADETGRRYALTYSEQLR